MLSRFEHFSFAVSIINRHIQTIAAAEMEKYGLKGAHALYLSSMHRYPQGLTASELCRISGRDKAAISRAVNEMETRGLIVRESTGGNLYRAKLFLTEDGKKAAEDVAKLASVAVDVASQGISDEQRILLYQMLDSIATNLQNLSQDGISLKITKGNK